MSVTPPLRADLWSRWFFRLVQLVGLVIGVHEALGQGRSTVLVFAAALILGAVGIRGMLRGVAELADVPEQASRERRRRD